MPPALIVTVLLFVSCNALQTGALVDHVSRAVFGGEFEEGRIENIHAAAEADQVHRPGMLPST